ncbi:oxygen-dependent protoporphyrinogen oxidase [Rhodotorula toruloides]
MQSYNVTASMRRSVPVKPPRRRRPRFDLIRTLPSPRSFVTSVSSPQRHGQPLHTLAILGGGLSGLSTAHYFLRTLSPALRDQTRIVVLEKEERVGGWCRAVRVQNGRRLGENEKPEGTDDLLVFETGPRSIRPVGLLGWLTIEMAHEIGIAPSIVTVPKTAPSARNRFIYTGHRSSTSISPTVKAALPTIPSALLEPFRPRSALHDDPSGLADESVDSFIARRFGRRLADELASAGIHGIYAGDTRRLSVRAVLPALWELEKEWGSVVLGALFGSFARRRGWKKSSPWRIRQQAEMEEMERVKERIRANGGEALVEDMEKASVWGVKGGLQVLTETLREKLEAEGVEFWIGEKGKVEHVEKVEEGWQIRTSTGALNAAQLVPTIPQLLPSSLAPPSLPATTVSVVNLAFEKPSPGSPPLHPAGFGYLIPRTVPPSLNPHHALGVIFDSDVMPDVDSSSSHGLTKLSLLLGGSYWLDRHPPPQPSHDDLVAAALETLRLHFPDRTIPDPVHAFTHTHVNCIPQVPPGFMPSFRAFGDRLREAGNVAVVGGGFAAVGVNGCVKAAWEVGSVLAEAVNAEAGGKEDEGEEKVREAVARTVKTGTEMWEL